MSFLSATPADQLVKLVSPQELNKRSLVQIVNSSNSRVLGQLKRGETVSIGASQQRSRVRPTIDLRNHYDAASLAKISIIHSGITFMNDGNVLYENSDCSSGSVVERTQAGVMAPQLYFQLLHDTIEAYLVTNRVSNAAEPQPTAGLTIPPGFLLLKNGDEIALGFNYCLVKPSGLSRFVAGNKFKLRAPDEVMRNGQLILPRLTVYIR